MSEYCSVCGDWMGEGPDDALEAWLWLGLVLFHHALLHPLQSVHYGYAAAANKYVEVCTAGMPHVRNIGEKYEFNEVAKQ